METPQLSHDDYTVGWICAVPLEMAAAKAMLDSNHPKLPQASSDQNSYALGEIAGHNVVIACLPAGVYGTTSATSVAKDMLSTYKAIRFGLMVGIGGGAPNETNDMRLGDVVVSQPSGSSGGVIQYDHGKTMKGGRFERTGMMNKPPQVLLTALSNVQSEEMLGRSRFHELLSETRQRYTQISRFTYPGLDQDQLFRADYPHPSPAIICNECDRNMLLTRSNRTDPKVFYGLIASANQVMKDSITRDQLAREHGISCFEMEAAGLMDHFPCLVIRGICDYSDSHKNKQWQEYAALTAAAYAKSVLHMTPVDSIQLTKLIPREGKKDFQLTPQDKECLRVLFLTDPEEDRAALKRRKGDRARGTCEWILKTDEVVQWLEEVNDSHFNNLFLYGNPGTGKSTMAVTITEGLPQQEAFLNGDRILAYFFCDSADETRRTVTGILRGLLYQLQKQCPHFLKYFRQKFSERGEEIFDSFDALWSIFINIMNDELTGHKYCVIDALDECDANSQQTLITQLNHYYHHLPAGHERKLHILITSRPYTEILEHLEVFRLKDLSQFEQRQRDIRKLITEKVQDLKQKKRYTESVEREVTQILLDKAEGTFLWIGIACQELSKIRSRDAVKALQKLPRGLHSLYRELLNNAIEQNQDEKDKIIDILQCVAVAQQTMTVSMLSHACQLYEDEADDERIAFFREDIEMCRLMVIIQDNVVRLLHKSVRDFLLETGSEDTTHILKAHSTLSYRCINYLIKWGLNEKASNQEFFSYSADCWPKHAHFARTEFSILDEHRSFFEYPSTRWVRWYRHISGLTGSLSSRPIIFTVFHAAASWDILALAALGLEMLEKKTMGSHSVDYVDLEFQDLVEGTPLMIAANRGNIRIIKMLLGSASKATKIHSNVINETVQNIDSGRNILQALLEHSECNIEITEHTLELAAKNTGCGCEIFEILISQYGDSIRPHISETVMMYAAENPILGSKLVGLIAERFHDSGHTLVTPGVLESAISNEQQNTEVVASLLSHTNEEIISELLVDLAIHQKRNTRDITVLLFSHAERASVLTERLLLNAASYSTQLCRDLITMTLEDATTYQISAEMAHLIIRWCDVNMIDMLLRVMHVDSRVNITNSMISSARDKDVKELLMTRMNNVQSNSTELHELSNLTANDQHVPPVCYSIKQIAVLKGHTDEVWCSEFSPDGSRLASGGRDGVVRIYDLKGFVCLSTLIGGGHRSQISCLRWSPDGKKLASGSIDKTIEIWDAETYTCLMMLKEHDFSLTGISWTPDGKSFVSSSMSYNNTFCHWTDTGELLYTAEEPYRAQDSCITPDGSQLILANTEPELCCFDLRTYAMIGSIPLEGKVTSITFDSDTNLVLLDLSFGELQIIDLTNGSIIQRYRSARRRGDFVTKSTFFADGNSLVLGSSENGKICVWDRHTGSLLDVLDQHSHGCVNSISTNPANPNMFVSTGDDRTVRVWEMKAKEE